MFIMSVLKHLILWLSIRVDLLPVFYTIEVIIISIIEKSFDQSLLQKFHNVPEPSGIALSPIFYQNTANNETEFNCINILRSHQ